MVIWSLTNIAFNLFLPWKHEFIYANGQQDVESFMLLGKWQGIGGRKEEKKKSAGLWYIAVLTYVVK